MGELRTELRRAVRQRFTRIDLERFKAELRDHMTHFLFERTKRSPIVIPVVNIINGTVEASTVHGGKQTGTVKALATQEQKHFQDLRARLLAQDQLD
jgi:hypothetical protein